MKNVIFILTLIICFNLEAKNNYTAQDTLFEIFPLKSHLHYTYDYFSESETREISIVTKLTIDSGIVEYIINDSTILNDTTIQWNVSEYRTIFHNDSISLYGGNDTSYWEYDTTSFSLIEKTTGFHKLISKGFIWKFPLIFPSDTQDVFRFSNVPKINISQYWTSCISGYDSLWFQKEIGFYEEISSKLIGGCQITHTINSTYIKLHNTPIVSVIDSKIKPERFTLEQNYPNPFNPNTTINYILSEPAFISLKVYDLLGREIKILDNGYRAKGRHSILFTANNLVSGVYFYQIRVNGFIKTKKLILQK